MPVPVEVQIDGQPADPERFVMPPLSLSSARADLKPHRFALTIAAADLLALMSDEYEKLVTELKADDQVVDDKDELAAAGYPALSELVTRAELVQLVFGGYLIAELLGKVTWTRKGGIDYWFDAVTECTIDSGQLTFHGSCYSKN